ncbi:MAG: hypothetical protein ACPGYV_06565 [Phycisphaeraceae bacterium]
MCQAAEQTETCQYCEKEIEECTCTLVCECGFELMQHEILDGEERCEDCRAKDAKFDWLEETCDQVESLARQHGWEIDGVWHTAQTGSRYVELYREGGEDDDELQTIKVRVSDHGSCYCSEDISLAMTPSGDDHTIECLAAALAKSFEADDA